MTPADEYLAYLRKALLNWQTWTQPERDAVLLHVLEPEMSPLGTNRTMLTALGAVTLDAIHRGRITIGKLERDKVLNGGM